MRPLQGEKNQTAAHQMVAMIAKLYLIEHSAKDMTPEERRETRQAQAKPLLEKIKSWLDKDTAENAIRPFVIGRRNRLFSGSPRGVHASATLYSLIETAKANQLEPWAYLNHLFEKLPTEKSEQALQALLPQNLKMEDLGR